LHQLGAYKPVPIAPTTFAQIKPAKINLSLVGRLNHGNANVLAKSAKTRQSEQGALKQGGIDLLVMPPKLKGRLPLWRVCSVEQLRGS
jgi:hypothetical protein